jgi:PAS domain S-box-containing protein
MMEGREGAMPEPNERGGAAGEWAGDLLAAFLEHADLGLFAVDRAGRVVAWNKWLAARTRRPAESVLGRPLAEALPDLPADFLQTLEGVLAAGQPRLLSPLLHPAGLPLGESGRHLLRLAPVKDAAGTIVGTAILVQELAPASTYEDGLESLYRLTLDAVAEGAWIVMDPRGRMVSFSAAAEEWLGWKAAGMIGRPFEWLAVEDAGAGPLAACLERAAREGGCETAQALRRRAGPPLRVFLRLFPLKDAAGRLQGHAALLRPRSEGGSGGPARPTVSGGGDNA